METTRVCAVMSASALTRHGAKKRVHTPYILYREIWLEGHDVARLKVIADYIMFYVAVADLKAYPVIIWERAGRVDVRWAGEPPAALRDRLIVVSGTSVAAVSDSADAMNAA